MQKTLPYLALCVGILALSMSLLFVRWADAPGVVTSFYRMALAACILLPAYVWQRRASGLKQRAPASTATAWAPHLLAVGAGFFAALDQATMSTAAQMTAVANATLLNNLAPVWVALFAVLILRQRLGARFWLGLLLACAGAAVVLGAARFQPAAPRVARAGVGDLVGLVSSLFFTAYLLVGKSARRRLDTVSYIWPVAATAALVLLVASLVLRYPLAGYPPATYLAFAGAALISQVVGYFSVGYALGHLPAAVVAATLIAQPVLTALLAIPLAEEPLQTGQIVGGLGVVAGIWLVVRSERASQEKEKTRASPPGVRRNKDTKQAQA